MHVLRRAFDVETAVRKLSSRFRRLPQVSRPKWPVISATKPLFYLIRVFGLAPFEISGDRFISGSYDIIYSVFCTLVQTCAIYSVLNRPASTRNAIILDVTSTFQVIFNYLVGVLNVIIAFWTRKEFMKVMDMMKNFDSRIRHLLGYPRKEGVTKVWAWSTCILTVSIWTIVCRSGMIAFNEYFIDNISYLLNYLVTSISIIKFSSVVLLLGQRFRLLNRIAKRYSKECAKSRFSAIDLKIIQQLHNCLMNAGESLRSQFSSSLLLWLANLCLHIVSTLYSVLEEVMSDWTKLAWFVFACNICWLVTFTVQLLLLHISCHFTSIEANGMGLIMINWTAVNMGRHCVNRNECYLHFINRRLDFTAAGCFHVNLLLLRSITAILTTYLVLMLQFTTGKRRAHHDS